MKTSLSVHRLKREAKALARREDIPHHQALDRVAAAHGFRRWSLLAAKLARIPPAGQVYRHLKPGDLVLVGARPGHGKTLLSLAIAVEAMRAGHRAVFFSLEYAERDIAGRFRALGVDPALHGERFTFDGSGTISAGHIIAALEGFAPGSLAVVDYLQLLDQRRDNPDLQSQVAGLRTFARERQLTMIFISQIDRSYDPAARPVPDIEDVRLPNPVDLSLFNKRCFLNAGELRFEAVN